jgi:hypothetical protein
MITMIGRNEMKGDDLLEERGADRDVRGAASSCTPA